MGNKIQSNQRGIISIVVTLIIVLILGVIILAFGNFTRREQTQTFERQLSSEAYYAAESGINDAIDRLRSTPDGTGLKKDIKDNCQTVPASAGANFDYAVDATGNVEYTCLLINPTPDTGQYSNIDIGESKTFPIIYPTPAAVSNIDIWWHNPDEVEPTNFGGCTTASNIELPQSWYNDCDAGMLRVDIVPAPTSGFTEASLLANNMTVYVKPSSQSSAGYTFPYNPSNNGAIDTVYCNSNTITITNPKHCRIQFGNLPQNRYYVRITALYRPAATTICSTSCSVVADREPLADFQAEIDATGRASDVVHRIQVRYDISGLEGPFPAFAIESAEDICKRFTVIPDDIIGDSVTCDSVP
jgi:hypothetical protein